MKRAPEARVQQVSISTLSGHHLEFVFFLGSKAGWRDRRTSSPVPDPQQHVQSSKESSPKSVTCDVETVTNMNTEVRAQPCAGKL